MLDSHLTFDKHVVDICKACSFHMRALRYIRPCLTDDVAKIIASAHVGSRLDYANAVLVGVSDKNITKLQRTQNALARIVTRKYERRGVTQSLKNLHWLPIKWRIDYKIAATAYKLITSSQQGNRSISVPGLSVIAIRWGVLFGMLMLPTTLFG